jgi:diaminopimelate epimerase
VKAAQVEGVRGFWLDLGQPGFGPAAVSAAGVDTVLLNGRELSHVQQLSALNGVWSRSQFVRLGNPHCVTLVDSADALPGNEQMREPALGEGLTRIAYAMPTGAGKPCPAGINLQWAMRLSPGHIAARVFERGEADGVLGHQCQCGGVCGMAGWLGRCGGGEGDDAGWDGADSAGGRTGRVESGEPVWDGTVN